MKQNIIPKSLLSVMGFFFTVVRPFKWYIVGQLIIHCFWATYISLSSYLTKKMIDVVNVSEPHTVVAAIKPYALTYFCSLIFIILMNRLYAWLSLQSSPRMEAETTRLLSKYLIDQSYSFYQEQLAGSLATNIRMIAAGIPKIIELVLERIFKPFITVVIALWTVSQVNGSFGFVLLLWFVLFMAGALYATPRLLFFASTSAKRTARLIGQLVDIISNTLTVRLFAGKKRELKRIDFLTESMVAIKQQRMFFFLRLHLFQGTLFILFMGVNLWLLIRGISIGSVTAGDFALILLLSESTSHLLWRISQDMAAIAEQIGLVEQGLQVIIKTERIADNRQTQPLEITAGKIAFENVYFGFQERMLFTDLSITIPSRQKVGLVGYSGSGKSTFVNLILRLFEIDAGKITIDDQDISQVTQKSLRQAIAFIPQDPLLFHRTIFENIKYARPDASYDEVVAAAQRSHSHEFIISLPQAYDTEVGERGGKLSGGQRQRIAIARAFLKNAPLLILDEATSQLDTTTEKYIQESLEELMADKTTLIIAHRLATLLNMDRILVFDQGVIVQDGTHASLLMHEGLYRQLWEHQSGGLLPEE